MNCVEFLLFVVLKFLSEKCNIKIKYSWESVQLFVKADFLFVFFYIWDVCVPFLFAYQAFKSVEDGYLNYTIQYMLI